MGIDDATPTWNQIRYANQYRQRLYFQEQESETIIGKKGLKILPMPATF